jgi:hypothetical protein
MIRAIGNMWFWFVLGTLAAAGCATTSERHVGSMAGCDVHATAHFAGDGAHVLVSGPAWLLHVDVEGRDDLALYAVARKDGTDADCTTGAAVEKKRLHPGQSNLVNLSVASDETICVASATKTRTASVMWHARRIDGGAVAGQGAALAYEAAGR